MSDLQVFINRFSMYEHDLREIIRLIELNPYEARATANRMLDSVTKILTAAKRKQMEARKYDS